MASRRRGRRRRRNGPAGTLAKIGLGILAGLITKGVRYVSAHIPSTKLVQDLSFVGMQGAAIFGAAYFSEPLMIGMAAGLGSEGLDIAQFWYAQPKAAATTDAKKTTGAGSWAVIKDPTGMGAMADVRVLPRGGVRTNVTARQSASSGRSSFGG